MPQKTAELKQSQEPKWIPWGFKELWDLTHLCPQSISVFTYVRIASWIFYVWGLICSNLSCSVFEFHLNLYFILIISVVNLNGRVVVSLAGGPSCSVRPGSWSCALPLLLSLKVSQVYLYFCIYEFVFLSVFLFVFFYRDARFLGSCSLGPWDLD